MVHKNIGKYDWLRDMKTGDTFIIPKKKLPFGFRASFHAIGKRCKPRRKYEYISIDDKVRVRRVK